MDEYLPCERCGDIRILDGAHRICFDCFIELDLEFHEKELLKELEEEE
jgi:ribosomal protein L32